MTYPYEKEIKLQSRGRQQPEGRVQRNKFAELSKLARNSSIDALVTTQRPRERKGLKNEDLQATAAKEDTILAGERTCRRP